ncbi:MAG: AraC family transcriptional regulator [Gemmatimonadaceae bacterium]|nr:AraC family transcriptional regulator [Gemmatimonadaceae bacterium]
MSVPQSVHRPAGAFYGVDAHEITVGDVLVGVRAADPNRHIPRHQHEDAHFVLVLSGHYTTTALDQRSTGPQLIYNPPGTTHADAFVSHPDRHLGDFMSVSLPPSFVKAHGMLGLQEDHARMLHHPLAIALAEQLARITRTRSAGHRFAADAAIWELVSMVSAPTDTQSRHAPPWLDRVLTCMLDSPVTAYDVQHLADIADVHPVYLARAFRTHLGMSPGTLHRRMRLAQAGALLRYSGTDAPTVSMVASHCGFVDQAHLTRTMRALWGMTPARYRESAAQKTPARRPQ